MIGIGYANDIRLQTHGELTVEHIDRDKDGTVPGVLFRCTLGAPDCSPNRHDLVEMIKEHGDVRPIRFLASLFANGTRIQPIVALENGTADRWIRCQKWRLDDFMNAPLYTPQATPFFSRGLLKSLTSCGMLNEMETSRAASIWSNMANAS